MVQVRPMKQIRPIKGDDSPFVTLQYCDVIDGFRFENLDDEFLTDYIEDLTNYYYHWEIVGQTFNDFFRLLKTTWNRNKEIVYKYANYDKTKIHFSFDTENVRTINVDESGSSNIDNENTNTYIDTPISNDDSTPSNIDTNVGSNDTVFDRSHDTVETVVNDDGDINRVNKLIDSYRSVLDVLINVFKGCFMTIESYTY